MGTPLPFDLTPRLLLGLESAIVGLIFVLAALGVGRPGSRITTAGVAIGVAGVLFGGYLSATEVVREASRPDRLRSPITVDATTLARARGLYLQHCAGCHGASGRGDGPLARTLSAPPADLRAHVGHHREGELYTWISQGVPNAAMPAFEGQLSAEERWSITALLLGFDDQGPPPAQTAVADMGRDGGG